MVTSGLFLFYHMQSKRTHILFIILILLFAFSRFIFLESDPAWWKSTDDIHDEAWWAENVRRLFYGEPWPGDAFARSFAVGPITALIHWIHFKLFGLNFFSLRLIALIPATASVILVLWKKIPGIDKTQGIQASALLVVMPIFWSMSRIGHVEALLSFMLILIALLSFHTKATTWFVIGILLTCALLIKLSFIYFLPALGSWFLYRHIGIKNLLVAFVTFFLLSSLSYLFYFYPFNQDFEQFNAYFSKSYYPIHQLLDPRGWFIRLAWLPEKLSVTTPMNCLLISGILIRIGQGTLPSRKTGFASLAALCLFFLLFSDFSDRRILVLLVLLPLVLVEPHERTSKANFRTAFAWILGIPLFTSFTAIIHPGNPNTFNQLFESIPWFLLIYTSLFLGAFYLLKKFKLDAPLIIFRSGILYWILLSIYHSSIFLNQSTHWGFLPCMIAHGVVIGFGLLTAWKLNWKYQFSISWVSIVVITSLAILSTEIIQPHFTLREAAIETRNLCETQGNGIGPETLVELSLLSSCKPMLYLDVAQKQNSKQYHWFAGITTPKANMDSLNRLFLNNAFLLSDTNGMVLKKKPVLWSPVGYRESVIFRYHP